MKNELPKEGINLLNGRKTLKPVLIDQSELFPAESKPVGNEFVHPIMRTQEENISKKETIVQVQSHQDTSPLSPKIFQTAKRIISELIDFNESGGIQIQNFTAKSENSSPQKTISYTSKLDEPENKREESKPVRKK